MSSTSFVEKWKKSFGSEAPQRRLPSGLLFQGPQGSGKKSAAVAIASSLLGSAEHHPDLISIAPEKNSIKIEVIRQLISRVNLKPFQASHVVVIIEDADTMTTAAANALLKTLEEPPDFVLFILMTATPEELPTTIRSRCQRVAFQIETETLQKNFSESFQSWQEDLSPLFRNTKQTFTTASRLAETLLEEPEKLPSLFDILKALWRDAAVFQLTGNPDQLLIKSSRAAIESIAARKPSDQLFRDIELILETERALDSNVNKTLALERLFVKLLGPA